MENQEIDRQIAEQVMGWKLVDAPDHWPCKTKQGYEDGHNIGLVCPSCVGVPDYSTNIAHAIKALEKVGWRAHMRYNSQDPDGKKYWVKFPLNSPLDWMGAATLEMAISTSLLAALEAIKEN